MFGGDGKPYGDDEPNDTHGWVEVPLDQFLGPAGDGCMPTFHVFLNRFESSSPDWEAFLHDPLRSMLMDPGDLRNADGWPDIPVDDSDDPRENVPGGALQAIRDDPRFRINGNFVNQHRKLSKIHASVIAVTSDDGISLTTHKDANSSHP